MFPDVGCTAPASLGACPDRRRIRLCLPRRASPAPTSGHPSRGCSSFGAKSRDRGRTKPRGGEGQQAASFKEACAEPVPGKEGEILSAPAQVSRSLHQGAAVISKGSAEGEIDCIGPAALGRKRSTLLHATGRPRHHRNTTYTSEGHSRKGKLWTRPVDPPHQDLLPATLRDRTRGRMELRSDPASGSSCVL